ncbi:MAG: hypothetical protein A3D64_01690 [Candidatus Wildermuthbacteria bacterium RIFCSPHIGHO2_02_FULL_49_9]|uniref:PIN domain-containing protein n=2 Tax=Candidatus Wildermuthiibacteriota TaxID=1817923 RepID=A0A1G2QZ76_9BACT|nr:MAG: hypothetical protein A2672_02295 [Candidatus Wildermuthbacteria bacterium RIFCSPHIGHO2_01_FULL_49_22b]OHA70547.1 MAG: hypothetical protein A3D64_01690 [Candidatus Wildermuthbacteria bacterium RIFCSPHIGHO2_02_FULL_49_9]
MIFLDTSAIYALADTTDQNHDKAVRLFTKASKEGEELFLHNYILIEATALIQRRLGLHLAKTFLKDSSKFTVLWIDASLHEKSVQSFHQSSQRKLSFVDWVSFLAMREKGVAAAFAFDEDFRKAGFRLYQ